MKTYNPAVLRSVIAQTCVSIKHRTTWLGLVLALIAWPTCVLFSPLGATLANANTSELAKELAFMSALLALALEEGTRTKHEWHNVRLSPTAALAQGIASRALLAVCAGSLALLPATLLSPSISPGDYLYLALSSCHLAALFGLLAALQLTASTRSVLVLILALALPASIQGYTSAETAILLLLDPRCLVAQPTAMWVLIAYQVASISALALVARCLSLPRST